MLPLETLCLLFAMTPVLSGHLVTGDLYLTAESLSQRLSTLSDIRTTNNETRVIEHVWDTFTDIAAMDTLGRSVVHRQEFMTYSQVRSVNIILLMKGERFGTHRDKLSVVGSHFDRIPGTSAVNDNGSGMVALLETAELIAKSEGCERKNSILFVAFDEEETGLQGSESFVQDYLLPSVLERYNISTDTFHGAYIMDTIMNYDNEESSQIIPPGLDQFFPREMEFVKRNRFRGDFLTAIGRKKDSGLLELFSMHWNYTCISKNNQDLEFKLLPLEISRVFLSHARDFMRSDHYNFWAYKGKSTTTGLKAIFLTDSGEYRGYMKECYHQPCDNMQHVTKERLQFLGITTLTLKTLLLEVSAENRHCYRGIVIEYLSESHAASNQCHIAYILWALIVQSILMYKSTRLMGIYSSD